MCAYESCWQTAYSYTERWNCQEGIEAKGKRNIRTIYLRLRKNISSFFVFPPPCLEEPQPWTVPKPLPRAGNTMENASSTRTVSSPSEVTVQPAHLYLLEHAVRFFSQQSSLNCCASHCLSSMKEHYQEKWEDTTTLMRNSISNWDYRSLFLSSCCLGLRHTAYAKPSSSSSELHLCVFTVMVTKPDHQYLKNNCLTVCFQMFLLSLLPYYLKSQQYVIY